MEEAALQGRGGAEAPQGEAGQAQGDPRRAGEEARPAEEGGGGEAEEGGGREEGQGGRGEEEEAGGGREEEAGHDAGAEGEAAGIRTGRARRRKEARLWRRELEQIFFG